MSSRSATILDLAGRFDCFDLALDHLERGTSAAEFRALALERMRNNMRGFSFRNAFRAMRHDPTSIDGFERECLEGWSGQDGFYHRRWKLPWHALVQRDLNVATAGAGGYLTDSRNLEPADILRPWSITARAGIEVLANAQSNALLPITSAKSSITWLADETSEASESTPTIGQAAGDPRIAIGLIEFSRNFSLQAEFDPWIRRELLKTAGMAIDQGVLNGSGGSGEMEGLLNVTGIGTETGASFTHAKALSMKRKCADANVDDETVSYLAPPATRELLEQRETIADSGQFVWQEDKVADRAASVSTDVPTATLIAGSWPTVMLLLWGNGIEVEFNMFDSTKFKQGIIQARVLVACDVFFPTPAAFTVATSVS